MKDEEKTKQQLIQELQESRRRISEAGDNRLESTSRTCELSQADQRLRHEIAQRKRIEQALDIEAYRFKALTDHAPFGMAMIGGNGEWKYINRKFTELFGYPFPDVPNGKAWFRKAYPDRAYRKQVISAWIEDMNRAGPGEARPRSLVVTCQDGSEKIVHFRTVQLGTGEHLMTCEDITDRKRAEQELQRHKNTLEALLNATTDIAVLLGRNGNMLAVNQEMAKTLGKQIDELLGLCIFDFLLPDTASRLRTRFETVVRTSEPSREEQIGQDGKIYDVNAYPVPSSDGTVEAVAVFARDITDRRKAEEELRESEAKYRTILETIAEGYHEVDLAGNLTLVNDSLCEINGYPREELLGMNYRQLMDEFNAKRIFAAYNKVYRTGEVNPGFEYELIRKDGTKKQVSVSIALVRDSNGKPTGFRGIFREIGEQKKLEEKLRQAAKMEAVGKLAGGVAHDFNNILTAVMGYTDILMRQLPKDSACLEKLGQIAHAAEKAADLTRQLLAFSRKQVLDVRVVKLNEVISDLEKMLKRMIGEDIELTAVLHKSLGQVQVDPVQIQQIVMNLAVNARDAMPGGGKLTLETANVFLDEEYARLHHEVEPGPYVMLCVTDSGIGMDPATRSRIFDPFFTTKERGVGTGLGLSTVYGIVKQHSGHISVYSEQGRGTSFKIYLPLVEAEPEELHKAPTAKPQPVGTETILIVEDEETLRELASEVLQMLGYKTLAASDWREAFQAADRWDGTIHLLLTDVVLPGMDGRSLFNSLGPRRPEMKVLYMSGYTDNAIVYHGVLDRGVHFLAKPFTLDALATKVREALDG